MSDETITTVPARPSVARWIIDRNPFYLLSAVCMLFGCIALTNSTSWTSIRLNRLLILTATLNFYEVLLIGLALFLIVRRGLRRDGMILLILEAFFLVDVTFLNAEIFAADFHVGLVINAILLGLAVVKVAAIFLGLGISLASGAFAVAMIELAMLFTLPGLFKQISTGNGVLPAKAIYAAWWAIGLLPIAATALMRDRRYWNEARRAAFRQSRGIIGLLIVLPVISLIAHLCTSNWVYNVRWYSANLSPLLLGLAVAIGASDRRVRTMQMRMAWHFVLPLAAIALAGRSQAALLFNIGPIQFAPLRCTLLGASLVYGQGFLLHRHILFAWSACFCLGVAGVGMSIRQIIENLNLGMQKTVTFSKDHWPRTMFHWGVISVVMSFVLLVVGAVVSLRKAGKEELAEERVET